MLIVDVRCIEILENHFVFPIAFNTTQDHRRRDSDDILTLYETNNSMIDPQLAADCHVLTRWPASHVLLHRNAILPWFILVPETNLENLLDLPPVQREQLLNEAAAIASLLNEKWGLSKTNVAQLGNVVSQLHLHVIGRRPGDDCWPKPVWGNLTGSAEYTDEEIKSIRRALDKIAPTP